MAGMGHQLESQVNEHDLPRTQPDVRVSVNTIEYPILDIHYVETQSYVLIHTSSLRPHTLVSLGLSGLDFYF
jgi:hypothetical protein